METDAQGAGSASLLSPAWGGERWQEEEGATATTARPRPARGESHPC